MCSDLAILLFFSFFFFLLSRIITTSSKFAGYLCRWVYFRCKVWVQNTRLKDPIRRSVQLYLDGYALWMHVCVCMCAYVWVCVFTEIYKIQSTANSDIKLQSSLFKHFILFSLMDVTDCSEEKNVNWCVIVWTDGCMVFMYLREISQIYLFCQEGNKIIDLNKFLHPYVCVCWGGGIQNI